MYEKYRKNYYQKNKERIIKDSKQWRKDNPEKFEEQKRKYQKSGRGKITNRKYRNSEKGKRVSKKYFQKPEIKFNKYKQNARERNLVWSLTEKEFMSFWQKSCYYCGGKIKTIGLDRIDNLRGYEMSNVIPCCEMCNRMKMAYSLNSFLRQCKKIVQFNKKC